MTLDEEAASDEWVNHITKRAAELTSAAYNQAIDGGFTVLVVEGTDIVEMSAHGRGKVVGKVKPKQRVVTGKKFKVAHSSHLTNNWPL